MDTQGVDQTVLQEAQIQPDKTVSDRSASRERQLANLRPFQKGVSGNPSGRKKKDLDLAALAQKHAEKAIMTLVDVMSDEGATPAARVGAASEILDRGFGRAPQSIDMNATMTLSGAFEDFIRMLNAGSGAKVIDQVVDAAE